MLDLKIIRGDVLDGTGAPAVRADVGVRGDTICDMGDLSAAGAALTLDAAGRIVCPGFIDVHSHSDAYLLLQPSADSKTFQGITTEVVGNCGASAAPLTGSYHMPADWRDKEYPGKWSTVAEYRRLLEQVRPAPNVVLLAGHNTLRAGVVGYENRAATGPELESMVRLLEQSIEEGACGLSTGLLYAPGLYAPREEIVELAKVAARHGGIYTSHIRSEGKGLLDAIDEALAIGREAGIRVEISHLKTSGRNNWALIDKALGKIREARDCGIDVAADRYPYTSSCTDLDVLLPVWSAEGGHEAVLARLRDQSVRGRIRDEIRASRPSDHWGTVMIGSTAHPDNRRFQGMRLDEAAKRLRMDPVEAALHLIETDELKTGAFFFGMCEENMTKILAEPYVMICTDASLRAPAGPLGRDYPHPRAYGSFPRFLRMSLDGRTVPLPEAVRKMTSLPAGRFRLSGRGVIATKAMADIVVFDPATVSDAATYDNPHQLAKGIEHVVVNGVPTLGNGRLTGNRAGRFLC